MLPASSHGAALYCLMSVIISHVFQLLLSSVHVMALVPPCLGSGTI